MATEILFTGTEQRGTDRSRAIAKAAKEGNLSMVASDREIVDAVRLKFISADDAMNQDT